MNINDFLKKSIRLLVENNISKDIIRSSSNASRIRSMLLEKLECDEEIFSEIFLVYVDDSNQLKAVIDRANLKKFIDKIINLDKEKGQAKDLNLEIDYPPKYILEKNTATIEDALKIFKSGLTDIIIVVEDGQYCGKIRKSELRKIFNIYFEK